MTTTTCRGCGEPLADGDLIVEVTHHHQGARTVHHWHADHVPTDTAGAELEAWRLAGDDPMAVVERQARYWLAEPTPVAPRCPVCLHGRVEGKPCVHCTVASGRAVA